MYQIDKTYIEIVLQYMYDYYIIKIGALRSLIELRVHRLYCPHLHDLQTGTLIVMHIGL